MEARRKLSLTLAAVIPVLGLVLAMAAFAATAIVKGEPQRPHRYVSCRECHVSPDLGTLVDFVLNRRPGSGSVRVGRVPDERCVACHPSIPTTKHGFSHAVHASKGTCVSCHPDTGHPVTAAALAEAGVPRVGAYAIRPPTLVAGTTGSASSLPTHATTVCQRCHDMRATACSKCHQPPAKHFTATCTTCHTSSTTWSFQHPQNSANCSVCHQKPAKHASGACTTCHSVGGKWAFQHPQGSDCVACHKAPKSHFSPDCATCHKPSVAFAATKYQHPTGAANCASCHRAPARHFGATCASCHTPSIPFAKTAFKHPGASAVCVTCHARPAGHKKAACTSCHSVGKSWAFRHPSSRTCASCHRAPSSHFGRACASCHRPSVAWRSATFRHPSVGEHSYRSFACSRCHPNGYSSATCRACHDTASGPSDGD